MKNMNRQATDLKKIFIMHVTNNRLVFNNKKINNLEKL